MKLPLSIPYTHALAFSIALLASTAFVTLSHAGMTDSENAGRSSGPSGNSNSPNAGGGMSGSSTSGGNRNSNGSQGSRGSSGGSGNSNSPNAGGGMSGSGYGSGNGGGGGHGGGYGSSNSDRGGFGGSGGGGGYNGGGNSNSPNAGGGNGTGNGNNGPTGMTPTEAKAATQRTIDAVGYINDNPDKIMGTTMKGLAPGQNVFQGFEDRIQNVNATGSATGEAGVGAGAGAQGSVSVGGQVTSAKPGESAFQGFTDRIGDGEINHNPGGKQTSNPINNNPGGKQTSNPTPAVDPRTAPDRFGSVSADDRLQDIHDARENAQMHAVYGDPRPDNSGTGLGTGAGTGTSGVNPTTGSGVPTPTPKPTTSGNFGGLGDEEEIGGGVPTGGTAELNARLLAEKCAKMKKVLSSATVPAYLKQCTPQTY